MADFENNWASGGKDKGKWNIDWLNHNPFVEKYSAWGSKYSSGKYYSIKIPEVSASDVFKNRAKGKNSGAAKIGYYSLDSGEQLKTFEGKDIAIGVTKTILDSFEEKDLKDTNLVLSSGGSALGKNSDFEVIAATLYAEAGYHEYNSFESAAIYDVLENRSSVDNKGRNVMEIIKTTGVYGYGSKDYKIALAQGAGYAKNKYSIARHNSARKGLMMGITNSENSDDYSKRSFFWESIHIIDNPQDNKNNYYVQQGYDTHEGNTSKEKMFKFTIRINETQFMIKNPDLKLTPPDWP